MAACWRGLGHIFSECVPSPHHPHPHHSSDHSQNTTTTTTVSANSHTSALHLRNSSSSVRPTATTGITSSIRGSSAPRAVGGHATSYSSTSSSGSGTSVRPPTRTVSITSGSVTSVDRMASAGQGAGARYLVVRPATGELGQSTSPSRRRRSTTSTLRGSASPLLRDPQPLIMLSEALQLPPPPPHITSLIYTYGMRLILIIQFFVFVCLVLPESPIGWFFRNLIG